MGLRGADLGARAMGSAPGFGPAEAAAMPVASGADACLDGTTVAMEKYMCCADSGRAAVNRSIIPQARGRHPIWPDAARDAMREP